MKIKALVVTSIVMAFAVSGFAQTTEGARIFSSTNSTQVVSVKQSGSGAGVKATANGSHGVGVLGSMASIRSGLNQGPNSTAGRFEINGSDGGENLILGIFDGGRVFRV